MPGREQNRGGSTVPTHNNTYLNCYAVSKKTRPPGHDLSKHGNAVRIQYKNWKGRIRNCYINHFNYVYQGFELLETAKKTLKKNFYRFFSTNSAETILWNQQGNSNKPKDTTDYKVQNAPGFGILKERSQISGSISQSKEPNDGGNDSP